MYNWTILNKALFPSFQTNMKLANRKRETIAALIVVILEDEKKAKRRKARAWVKKGTIKGMSKTS